MLTADLVSDARVDLSAEVSPAFRSRAAGAFKRAFALSVGLTLIAMLLPLLLAIAVGVCFSGRQIFFAHKRIGRNGKKFRCLKFRSMHMNAEQCLDDLLASDPQARAEWQRHFKLKNDPRVTRFGAFLRKTSLDELPQLINVIRGDMCLVGPRPIVDEELIRYGRYARFYLAARPGMTGLWQVSGRNNTGYRRRIALDYAYVRSQCIGLDLKILLRTIPVVMGLRAGAY